VLHPEKGERVMIDFDKLGKYSKAGPRYTSYPTAVEFHGDFDEAVYIDELKAQDSSRPLSLYFHLPFCRSACYFCGCNVVYTSKEDKKERYIEYLKKELAILSNYLNTQREVIQLHFGGGTPTFFDAQQLDRIIVMIKEYFPNYAKDAEISCEIDPRFINEAQLDVLVGHGFNRVSFGIQDFDEKVQEAVHRVQPYDLSKQAIELSRAKGIESVNIDLIYGLPYQSFESFKETLSLAHSLDPDRLAVFNYAHVPWMKKTMRKIDETTLPTPSVKLEIMKYAIDFFQTSGYKMIGMDHFAKPEDELFRALSSGELHRNFQGYTTKGGADLIGIGLTSIGEGASYYVQNHKEMSDYEAALDQGKLPIVRGIKLSADDSIRQYVIMELMSNFSLNIGRFNARFDVDFKTYFADALEELQIFVDDGLVSIDEAMITVSDTGVMLIRNISMPFDSYLKKIPESKRRFSKTV
jgi:oxygen-independent coproporphyrinogen-3 oxidase